MVVATGLGATGVCLLALSAARTPEQILVTVALVGLAFEIYEPASQELVAQVAEGEQRGRLYAMLGAALVAAGAIAGVMASVLLPIGVRWLMVVDAATCLTASVVALAFLPRSRREAFGRDGRRWRPPARLIRLTAASTAFAVG
ncbi:MFS transporter [Nonomuraea solani]|uniref:MFS transporter n=1 Tax=Nonomuraea solani TaxID=1144553 RepID=UPI000CDEF947|nr:MFS transporter [Nonomuraea solani]